jgi:hypothetical protein
MARPRSENPALAAQRRKVKDIKDLGDDNIGKASPKVRELQVSDLNDLANKFHGIPVANPRLEGLTIDDYKSLEAVFQGYKQQLEEKAARGEAVIPGEEEIFDNWSCCCCTPCCCCAAAEVDPFAA